MRAVELTHTNCPRGLTIQRSSVLQLVSSFKERKRIENEKSKEYKITKKKVIKTEYSGDYSVVVLPESIPNSEVKCRNADGSVGIPHVRVGHRQILFP